MTFTTPEIRRLLDLPTCEAVWRLARRCQLRRHGSGSGRTETWSAAEALTLMIGAAHGECMSIASVATLRRRLSRMGP